MKKLRRIEFHNLLKKAKSLAVESDLMAIHSPKKKCISIDTLIEIIRKIKAKK